VKRDKVEEMTPHDLKGFRWYFNKGKKDVKSDLEKIESAKVRVRNVDFNTRNLDNCGKIKLLYDKWETIQNVAEAKEERVIIQNEAFKIAYEMKNYELMYNISFNAFFRDPIIFYELTKTFSAERITRKQLENFKEDWERLN
jgi:hypothetical protein